MLRYRTQDEPFRMSILEAHKVADKTHDAYSFDRYVSWLSCAMILRGLGYDVKEAEAILRSKHMRWASDQVTGIANGRHLKEYMTDPRNLKHVLGVQLAELVDNTFPKSVCPSDMFSASKDVLDALEGRVHSQPAVSALARLREAVTQEEHRRAGVS